MKSRVKWFNNEKGYGFLEYDGVEDVFVHYSQIEMSGYKTLSEGDEVEFGVLNTDKGLQAKEVKPLKDGVSELICT